MRECHAPALGAISQRVDDLHEVEIQLLEEIAAHEAASRSPIARSQLLELSRLEVAQFVRRLGYLRRLGFVELVAEGHDPEYGVTLTTAAAIRLEVERLARLRVYVPQRRRCSDLAE